MFYGCRALVARPVMIRTTLKSRTLYLLASVAALLLLPAWQPSGSPAAETAAPGPAAGQLTLPGEDYVQGQVLVQFSRGAAPEVIPVPVTSDEESVAEVLEERPGIISASPNYIARISRWIPDDPGVNPPKTGGRAGWQKRQWNLLPCFSLCSPDSASNSLQSRGGANVIRAWQNLRQAGRAGAVLGDDDVGYPLALGGGVVDLFAVDEHDDVGVLLDRTRFTKVGEHRAVIRSGLDRA